MDDAASMQMPPRSRRFPIFLGLLTIMAAASALWLIFLWHSGVNYQEQYSLQLASGSVHPVATYGSPDDPMPLYYLLLSGFIHITVPSLDNARLLSFICLLLTILVAYAVGKKMSDNRRVGLTAAALVGLSPFILWYNSRATMYPLLLLVALINQYLFVELFKRARWWLWTGYIISGLAGLGVHYFFALILALQGVFAIIKHREFRGWKRVGLGLCLAVFATAFVLWLHYSSAHTTYWSNLPYTSRPSATNAFIIYVQYLFGFQSVVITTLIIAFWPFLVILSLLAVQKYVRPPVGVQYAVWAATAPVIIMLGLGWLVPRPLFLTSYLVVSATPFLLFLSWYFTAFNLRSLTLARNIFLIAMVIAFFVQFANIPIALREDYLRQPDSSNPAKLVTLPGS
ncbi:MAG TPA: glycosyltransferase family 39 protein [Candidatus Saccharimonadales bacterium]